MSSTCSKLDSTEISLTMDYTTVRYEKDGRIGRVTFSRPEVHNAFNATLIHEMADLFARIDKDNQIRVVILTGEGKSFCSAHA